MHLSSNNTKSTISGNNGVPKKNVFNVERFQAYIKNSFDILVLLDENGIQRYVSNSCERILGYKPDELTGITVIEEMIHPNDRKKTLAGFQNILENSTYGGTQYRHKHKNGGWVYLEAFGTNQLANPDIGSVVINVRDITERKKTEQALRESRRKLLESNKMKDRLYSIIGHDLKGPFSGVLGLSELLKDDVTNKNYENIEKYSMLIHKSSKQAFELLLDLLEWARTQTNHIEYQPEYFLLNKLLNDILELLHESANKKELTITKLIPDDVTVFADKYMISSIIRNLLSNSIKFTHIRGKITVQASKTENEILISVFDNGMGLTDDVLTRLFQIDHIKSKNGTSQEKGTGLGLLICKEFLDYHGGRIWAEKRADKGSVFHFTLPHNSTALETA